MAGSYNHCVDHEGNGALYDNDGLNGMLENGGDVYEAVEEMYGMIWYLAATLGAGGASRETIVEDARRNYKEGLNFSPGTEAHLDEEDSDE